MESNTLISSSCGFIQIVPFISIYKRDHPRNGGHYRIVIRAPSLGECWNLLSINNVWRWHIWNVIHRSSSSSWWWWWDLFVPLLSAQNVIGEIRCDDASEYLFGLISNWTVLNAARVVIVLMPKTVWSSISHEVAVWLLKIEENIFLNIKLLMSEGFVLFIGLWLEQAQHV